MRELLLGSPIVLGVVFLMIFYPVSTCIGFVIFMTLLLSYWVGAWFTGKFKNE